MMQNSPLRPSPAPTDTTVPPGARKDSMTSAELRALTARKPAAKGKTSTAPPQAHSAREIAKEQAARQEAVGVGLLAWENPVFGLPCFYRKYRLLDEAQAAELDRQFHLITGTQP